MLSLPVVFLCNTLLFMTILNSRFRIITTCAVSGAAYALSLLLNTALSPALHNSTGMTGNVVCVCVLLAASVFLYTNNLVQKLFVAILLICNYAFLVPLTESLLGSLPFGNSGFGAVLTGIVVYVFFSFLSMITFVRPFHYFANRGISVLSIGLCCAQGLCLLAASGRITDALGITAYAAQFFLTVLIYAIIAFAVRSAYNAARFKERECRADYRDALLQAEAEYFNAMVGNVTNAKTARDHHSFVIQEIAEYARQGNCEGVLNTIADASVLHDPLLEDYSENPYINAVMAGKAAYAQHCGIRLESNVELGSTNLKTIEFCVILNEVLEHAIDSAQRSSAQDKYVRMTVLPVEDRITFEAVYSAPVKEQRRTAFTAESVTSILKSLLDSHKKDELKLETVRGILERSSGTMNLSAAGGSEILRIVINN
ncbi:MAG: hypothetical protein IJF56_10125 [Clostridia bacterium]|nr:hypothetical protein [Clostridia bacterium]